MRNLGVLLDHAALDFKGAQPSADYGDRQPPAAAIMVRARKRFNPRSGSSAMMARSSSIGLIAAAIFGISRMLLARNDVAGSATTARGTTRQIVDGTVGCV